ncbi:MAG: type I restriction enzyme HsdR N-terminal domain-containing protein [Sphingobacteriia bacterium]|nr:MAG: type I restriction enzyme HsdR N-terminal domain-containing protein [Sphingobacteriia bacterium]
MIIQYPLYQPEIKEENEKEFIFDSIRKQWIRLTPEEWVRQNFINYLIKEKKYPASLIAIEKEIKVGEMRKRFDILVYKESTPWLIVECKELKTPINDAVAKQVITYNIQLQVPYLIITNGNTTRGLYISNGQYENINAVPMYY